MKPPLAGLWSKLPGYESDEGLDEDDEDDECGYLSDSEELRRASDERLPAVKEVLGDRWTDRELMDFNPPEYHAPQPKTLAAPSHPAPPPIPKTMSEPRLHPPFYRLAGPATTFKPASPRPSGPTFRINGIDAPVLRETLQRNGLHSTKEKTQTILWSGSRVNENFYRSLNETQKINHFPGSTELTQKDRMWCNFRTMAKKFGKQAFNFIPETYVLPAQLEEFLNLYQRTDYIWIVKPHASSCGRGIFMLKNIDEIPLDGTTVVSRYVHQPLLIQGLKFDLRIYVVVTSFEPLRAYVYREGLVRFASKGYSCEGKYLHDVYRHLTNYSVNKNAPGFQENQELENDNIGHKWSFSALNKHLEHEGIDHDLMWTRIMDLLVKTLLSVQPAIAAKQAELGLKHSSCFEVYGFDVLVDEALKPWLLEVNLSPSMRAESPLDWRIKSSLLSDAFNLVGVAKEPVQEEPSCQDAFGLFRPWGRMWNSTSNPRPTTMTGLPNYCASTGYRLPAPKKEHVEKKHGILKETLAWDQLSQAQLTTLAQSLEEIPRSRNFCRLYPTKKAIRRYARITDRRVRTAREEQMTADGLPVTGTQLLATVLFGPTPVQTKEPPPPAPEAEPEAVPLAEKSVEAVVSEDHQPLERSVSLGSLSTQTPPTTAPNSGNRSEALTPPGSRRTPPSPSSDRKPRLSPANAVLAERLSLLDPKSKLKVSFKPGLPPMKGKVAKAAPASHGLALPTPGAPPVAAKAPGALSEGEVGNSPTTGQERRSSHTSPDDVGSSNDNNSSTNTGSSNHHRHRHRQHLHNSRNKQNTVEDDTPDEEEDEEESDSEDGAESTIRSPAKPRAVSPPRPAAKLRPIALCAPKLYAEALGPFVFTTAPPFKDRMTNIEF